MIIIKYNLDINSDYKISNKKFIKKYELLNMIVKYLKNR